MKVKVLRTTYNAHGQEGKYPELCNTIVRSDSELFGATTLLSKTLNFLGALFGAAVFATAVAVVTWGIMDLLF